MEDRNKKFELNSPNMLLALGLIVVGLAFLLDNLGILDSHFLWELWPVIFILIGISKLKKGTQHDKFSGGLFIATGAIFLLTNLDILMWHSIWQFWPLVLIFVGISILMRHKEDRNTSSSGNVDSAERIDAIAIFGGTEKMVTTNNFSGGTISAIFGGCKIDLTNAELTEGDSTLDIFTLFGGTEMYIPKDWNIVVNAIPIFGGCEDSRRNVDTENLSKTKVLHIKGLTLFGGLEIK